MKPTFDNLPALTAALVERVAALEALLNIRLEKIEIELKAGNNKPQERRNFYSVKQIMEMYSVSKTTIYNWIKSGLKFEKLGGKTIIYDKDLQKFIKDVLKH